MDAENHDEISLKLRELAEKLGSPWADRPALLGWLLQSRALSASLPLGTTYQSTSASVAQPYDSTLSAGHRQLDLDDLAHSIAGAIEDEFTVTPTDKGGQSAGKGIEFQDIYTVFLLTRFLDEDMPATLIRVEGAEDIDLITVQDNRICEWYYQVKTIKEGSNWTLRMFETEGVWSRFAHCISEFSAKCLDPTRSIQVVLVVDGDVTDEVQMLRDWPRRFVVAEHLMTRCLASDPIVAKVRGEALASIVRRKLRAHYADEVLQRALESSGGECAQQLRQLCSALIQKADGEFVARGREQRKGYAADIIRGLLGFGLEDVDTWCGSDRGTRSLPSLLTTMINSLELLAPSEDHLGALGAALTEAYALLDPLFSSLKVHSRIGFSPEEAGIADYQTEDVQNSLLVPSEAAQRQLVWRSHLEDSILFRLVEHTHLSAEHARRLYEGDLKRFVRRAAQNGLVLNRSLFLLLISQVPRVQLEGIPETEGLNPRTELVDEIVRRLGEQGFLYLYGFSKIGKTKIAAMVARRFLDTHAAFWHTIGAGGDSVERLVGDLAHFAGDLTGSRNLDIDWLEKKRSVSTIANSIALALKGYSVLLVLDNCHLLDEGGIQTVSYLLQALTSESGTRLKVLTVGEDRSVMPTFASTQPTMRVGGFTLKESVVLLEERGCHIGQDCYLEFVALHSRIAGHPLMLQIAARELGAQPSACAISVLASSLPELNQDTARFFDQLGQRIYGVLTTAEQKETLQRLSVLIFAFDRDLAFALAKCNPSLDLKPSDWLRLTTRVLEHSYRGCFVVPDMFKQLAADDVCADLKLRLYEAAASHILDSAANRRRVDFEDFQNALFYLSLAGQWKKAATYFLGSLAVNPTATYEQLRFLYSVFRGPAFQDSDVDPGLRSALALSEFSKVTGDAKIADKASIMREILGQMHSAVLSIKDHLDRAVQTCMYYLALSAYYDFLLAQDADSLKPGISRDESLTVVDLRKRSLHGAKEAFSCALMSRSPELVQKAFWVFLHVDYLAPNPSVEEIPRYFDQLAGDPNLLGGQASQILWRGMSAWHVISSIYQNYADNHPLPDAALSELKSQLEFARDRGLLRLQVVVHNAIAQWYFERGKDYSRAISICNDAIATAETLSNNTELLKATYTLRADSEYALGDYQLALTDYTLATQYFPSSRRYSTIDVAIQSRVGDCYWHSSDYPMAAAGYLRALKMRGRTLGYNHANSFRLFGKLSLAYLCMGQYWNAIRLQERMFSVYERFRDETMFVRLGGSIQGILTDLPNSWLDDNESLYREKSARAREMGPRFYDAPMDTKNLQPWLDRVSPATFRFLLAHCYDLVGDIPTAISQGEASLLCDHRSSFIQTPIVRSLTYELLSELYRKAGDLIASARAAFNSIALTEDFLASARTPRASTEAELFSEVYLAKAEAVRERNRDAVPADYAQTIFRHSVEPVILEQINSRRRFDDQAAYFLTLTDLAAKLPPGIQPCIEAWAQLYLGLFYISRRYELPARIAFERMEELITEHGLFLVDLACHFHMTFGLAAQLHQGVSELMNACITLAAKLIETLPRSEHLLGDYSRRCIELWCTKARIPPDDPLAKAIYCMIEKLQNLERQTLDIGTLFYHICAILVSWAQGTGLWSDSSRKLQREVLSRPLNRLDSSDLFVLYDEFGKFARGEAQRHILNGNVGKAQELSTLLLGIMSSALDHYESILSSEQVARLQDHQVIARLWGG